MPNRHSRTILHSHMAPRQKEGFGESVGLCGWVGERTVLALCLLDNGTMGDIFGLPLVVMVLDGRNLESLELIGWILSADGFYSGRSMQGQLSGFCFWSALAGLRFGDSIGNLN